VICQEAMSHDFSIIISREAKDEFFICCEMQFGRTKQNVMRSDELKFTCNDGFIFCEK